MLVKDPQQVYWTGYMLKMSPLILYKHYEKVAVIQNDRTRNLA